VIEIDLRAVAVVVLALGAVVTFGFGVAYLAASRRMARMVGIDIPSPGARADYRAIYGGAQVALGVFFALAASRPAWREPGLAALALFAAGFGVARLGSLAVERDRRDPQWIVGALELVAGLVAAALARHAAS
jgi:hypothetical protein